MAEFPSFYGAEIEELDAPNGGFRIRSVMPCPGAPNDRVIVTTSAGADVDPQIVYEINKRDALSVVVDLYRKQDAGEHDGMPADDRDLWLKRYDDANKPVRQGQIMRTFAAGNMTPEEALMRLGGAGFDFKQAADVVDQHRGAYDAAVAERDTAEDGEA